MINSNREAYAQYGKLDDARMEALFDAEDRVGELEGIIDNLIDNNEAIKEKLQDLRDGHVFNPEIENMLEDIAESLT